MFGDYLRVNATERFQHMHNVCFIPYFPIANMFVYLFALCIVHVTRLKMAHESNLVVEFDHEIGKLMHQVLAASNYIT